MHKSIILDDEKVAQKHIQRLIETDGRLHVSASFSDAAEALGYCEKQNVGFVFADIEMPHMDGLEFGRRLKSICPKTKLIYVTAYSQYALEAYNNFAVGYLLKPVAVEKVSVLLNQFVAYPKHSSLKVNSLGSSSVTYEEELVKFRTNKAKELFYYLLYKKGQAVSVGTIIENLWRGGDVAFAKKQLHNSLFHLRSALKSCGLSKNIQYELGAYRLVLENIEWDYAVLEDKLNYYKNRCVSEDAFLLIDAINSGLCFEDCDYLWAAEVQNRLEIKLQRFYEEQLCNDAYAHSEKVMRILKAKCSEYEE